MVNIPQEKSIIQDGVKHYKVVDEGVYIYIYVMGNTFYELENLSKST